MATTVQSHRFCGPAAATGGGNLDALNRVLSDLCTRGNPKDGATLALRKHVEEEARDLSGEAFFRFMDQLYERITNLLESSDVAENLGALRAIDELIDLKLGENASKISKFSNYMRTVFESKRDPEILILASRVLGHLARAGGAMTADEVERQVKNALEWLRGERVEYRRFAAVLILKEMAENASTVFNVHVPEFVDAIWVALRDPTLAVRERAVEALRACLRVIEKRETRWRVQWYYRMFEATQDGLGRNAPVHSIHGSLLAVGELLRNTGEFMMSRYREVAEIVLRYLEHRDRLVRLSITSLLPRIAHFLRDRFVTNYLTICMNHILAVLKIPAERASGFIALGEMAGALDGELYNYLPTITSHIRDAIAPRRGRPSLEALACIGSIAKAMGPAMEPHVHNLLDSMFAAGLSFTLVEALEQITVSIPSLLPTIQDRLLECISAVLLRSHHTQARPSITSSRANVASTIQQISELSGSALVQLALQTLARFNFKGHDLLEFARESVVVYLEDEDGVTRKDAAICCCKLVANSFSGMLSAQYTSSRSSRAGGKRRRLVEEIVQKLLIAAVADADVIVRHSIFSSLHGNGGFDDFLAQADSLTAIFAALNDEDFIVREYAISVAGRLSEKNPAYVLPALRRHLIQLLTYLEQSADSKCREESAKLLGCLIRNCERLILPYIAPIHKALVAKLCEGTGVNANNGIISGVLVTVGDLARVGGFAMRQYIPELIPLIVEALLDGAAATKREVAVATLGQVVQSTGYVITPYNEYPQLLGLLLKLLNGELAWSTRREVLKVIGIMGALDPHVHKRNQQSLPGSHGEVTRAASDTGQNIRSMEELPMDLWPSFATSEDYFSTVAINSLMRILRDPSLSSYHQKVVGSLMFIFKSMGVGCVPYLPKVLPDLFHTVRTCEDGLKEYITWKLGTLVSIVRQHIRKYLPELLSLISELWSSFSLPAANRPVLGSPILHLVEQLCLALNDEFRTYLPVILPCCIQVLSDAERCNDYTYVHDILHTLEVFGGTLDEHMHLLLPALIRLFKVDTSVDVRRAAIKTLTRLIPRVQVTGHISALVHHLKLVLDGKNDELRRDAVDALCCLAHALGEDFTIFIPSIHKILLKYRLRHKEFEEIEGRLLNLKNHLSGLCKTYLKISFDTVQQLMHVKSDLVHVVERNQAKFDAEEAYESILIGKSKQRTQDFIDYITDLREYDVPYHVRFAIDKDVRCGQWYDVNVSSAGVMLERRTDLLQRAEVHVCAFDIETTKLPLKFPDAEYDLVMMISYMIDGRGYLIINRECVGEDIEDLEYTPKPEFEGCFKVINVKNEEELLRQWFNHMQELKPGIYVTYNGDFFDWPFLESRAAHHGFRMSDELGFQCDYNQGECRAKFACHLDCFAWVKRDSYLPQGSQGLKAVTKAKLGYDPLEVNPEDMVRFAMEKPQMMASYSVSDAVSTYYLYMTYVHPFIFSLGTIIPMPPDEVLRKGSGTLCEMLLMVQAYKANVICPNKHQSDPEKFFGNQLLESETYIGGHVECLESGVFRSDLPTSFKLDPSAYEQLINNLDRDLQYAIRVEGKMDVELVSNYEEVKNAILEKLIMLRDEPLREECPLIYHLDVAAMYPNIILTNRLQPPSIVSDEVCTACDFNRPGKTCLRNLEWVWRGETYMAKRSDYYHLKRQIESELVDSMDGHISKPFLDLPKVEQQLKLKDRLKKYCQKAYKRVLNKPVMELREAGICMRENPFYVDTVRSFRDRRYEYKGLNKVWKGKLSEAKASGNPIKIQEAQDMVVLYDSLQLAHKCILNSFYGYVMRKGARWYSMEMAGVVTYTGAKIIQNARLLVEKIGRPLELDTDGIWCALPGSFPENFTFKTKDLKKKLTISYPCVMLNVDVAMNNTNEQYQTLKDSVNRTYSTHSECSIEFEVDGPYKAMILPASKEEGILIKKRYAVFNDDGTLAELKGFEIKRRGELKLIKVFQAELFDKFLHGSTLEECYAAVASVANRWLDLLDNQGKDIADSELLDYISESSTMSKSLADYGVQKSCAVTTAKRLADFLGDTMVKDKGLRCQYIVACEPRGNPVSERAVPVAIFETDAEIMKFYVKKWCKISSEVGIRSIIDWSYYKQRLCSAIQKIVTIPAAMQKVSNPVPRVVHPDWLHKKVREKEDKFRQRKLVDIFSLLNKDDAEKLRTVAATNNHEIAGQNIKDLEDFRTNEKGSAVGPRPIARCYEVSNGQHLKKKSQVNYSKHHTDHSNSVHELLTTLQQNTVCLEDIDRNLDYQGWLDLRKRKWKEAREKRKRRRLNNAKELNQTNDFTGVTGGVVIQRQAQGKSGVNSYFERQELAITRCHWQIIQIEPTSQHGRFSAWVVVEGVMRKIPITVPRVFYLNSKAPVTEDFPGRRVNKILPHGHRSYNLIEVIIDEDQFRAESKKLAAHLADPEVEGIYETKVPSELNAIFQIGCVCKVDKTAKKRNAQNGWSLSELHMKTTTECSYLEQSFSFFYLYHSISEGRAVYVGYYPASGTISVVVVNPFQNKELSPHILEKQFRDACHALSVEPSVPRDGISFKVDYVGYVKDAEKILQKTIIDYRQRHHGPAIAVIECPNVHLMKSSIRALNEFPCVNIPSNARDSQYQALGWQIIATKIGMQRCAASSQWLNERISLSRYAHVPLGNFELDWLIHTADIFFARALRDHQQVLWISDNDTPDLGGTNEEESCYTNEVNQPVLNYPGAYRKVTVEFKIHNLAVNALLKSNQVNEMEGGVLFGFDYDSSTGPHGINEQSGFDEATSCAPAFRVLKQLIQRCLADAVTSGNVFADAILQHLYRWLCSPQSKLHDPALHRMLHKVMQKVFALLLAEFRKLGAAIIFANFAKIIIDTGKSDLSAAKAYSDSLIRALQTRDLFEWIELEPLQFWHSLLFMDQYNYGGIQARVHGRSSEDISKQNDEDVLDESQVEIVSSWNVVENIPKEMQDHFILVVSEFMYLPWKEQAAKRESMRDGSLCTPSITAATAETFESQMAEYIRGQVTTYFTGKLLSIVRDANLHMKGMSKSQTAQDSSNGNPQLDGNIFTGDPALEFIKHVCAVLALDQSVQHDILIMRKNLLKYVRVREFAPEAEFHNHSLSFTLPNVICSYCNDCRDLDLCRDRALMAQEWRCAVPQCGQPYDREVMENDLLQIVRQRERLYHLQDLVCLKCNQVKAAHLAEHCACAGSFRCNEVVPEFRNRMQVFLKIAIQQKFQLLQECTSWILEIS